MSRKMTSRLESQEGAEFAQQAELEAREGVNSRPSRNEQHLQ